METPTTRRAKEVIAPVVARKDCEQKLEVCIRRADEHEIKKLLAVAQELDRSGSSSAALKELTTKVTAAEKMLTHIERERQALEAMRNCTKTGGWFKDGDAMPKWEHIEKVCARNARHCMLRGLDSLLCGV